MVFSAFRRQRHQTRSQQQRRRKVFHGQFQFKLLRYQRHIVRELCEQLPTQLPSRRCIVLRQRHGDGAAHEFRVGGKARRRSLNQPERLAALVSCKVSVQRQQRVFAVAWDIVDGIQRGLFIDRRGALGRVARQIVGCSQHQPVLALFRVQGGESVVNLRRRAGQRYGQTDLSQPHQRGATQRFPAQAFDLGNDVAHHRASLRTVFGHLLENEKFNLQRFHAHALAAFAGLA